MDNSAKIELLEKFKMRNHFSSSGWNEWGASPSDAPIPEAMHNGFMETADKLIEALRHNKPKASLKRILLQSIESCKRLPLDTEDREYAAELFYVLSEIVGADIRHRLNIFLYGYFLIGLVYISRLFKREGKFETFVQSCPGCNTECSVSLDVKRIYVGNNWVIGQCTQCGSYFLFENNEVSLRMRYNKCRPVEYLPKNEYTQEQAYTRLEQVRYFRKQSFQCAMVRFAFPRKKAPARISVFLTGLIDYSMLKSISEYCKTAALAVVIAGCGTVSTRHQGMQVFTANDTIPLRDTTAGSLASFLRDTVILAESCNEEDVIVNEYLLEQLKPIRKNFRRINGVTRWTSIRKRDLWQSTEGGVARYYYLNGNLEKVVARHFGETGQKLSEYYLMKGQLSFVFEKQYRYNRPMYYDSASMKANNDTVAFAFEDSEVTEDRSYFDKGKMVHIVLSGDCGVPFAASFLASEEERIKADFTGLLALVRKNR